MAPCRLWRGTATDSTEWPRWAPMPMPLGTYPPWQGGTVAFEVALTVTGSPVNVTGTVARSTSPSDAVSEDLVWGPNEETLAFDSGQPAANNPTSPSQLKLESSSSLPLYSPQHGRVTHLT